MEQLIYVIGQSFIVQKVIFASSMAVYKSSQHPLKETEIVKPNSVYGKTKVESEKLIKNLERYNITAIITRPL